MKSILLVDDEVTICIEMQKTLDSFGYHAESAHTFESALLMLRSFYFDAIVVEFNLRSKTNAHLRTGKGADLIRRLRSEGIKSLILMYTTMQGPLYQAASLAAGANDFMVKEAPFSKFIARLNVHFKG